ncbi:MAG: hypothetical protein AB7F43_14225 [Bacteriovoracia bacterium]
MIEFALLVPIVVGLFVVLVNVEKAISVAIVNQKYARAQVHYLFFNNRYYPENKFLYRTDGRVNSRWWLGVTDVTIFGQPANQVEAIAPEISISKRRIRAASSDDVGLEYPDITSRQKVRVRVTAFACVPPVATASSGVNLSSFYTEGDARGSGALTENTFGGTYPYCTL